ncbi:MAG: hypothetical protein ACYC2T_02630 [Bacillota bacterium]
MEDQIALLRKLSNQQDIRKKLIGGFSEEDVNAYVNNIYAHFQQIEDEYKQNIEKLDSSNSELINQFDAYKRQTAEQMVKLQESLNAGKKQTSEITRLTGENNEFKTQIDQLVGQLSAAEQDNEQLRAHTEELAREKNVHTTQISSLEKEISSTRIIVRDLDEKLKQKNNANPINNIHAMLDQLKDQITVIDNLQQQLELERNRAEKAEKEMSQFWGWASSLKERIHKDQLELEVQFTEIDEKYKAMHAEVNGLRTNLENFRLITEMEIDEFYNTVGNMYDISEDDGQVKQIR